MTAGTPTTTASSRFVDAERAVLERFAVTAKERYLDLAEPRLRVRVLDSGDGPPSSSQVTSGAIAIAASAAQASK